MNVVPMDKNFDRIIHLFEDTKLFCYETNTGLTENEESTNNEIVDSSKVTDIVPYIGNRFNSNQIFNDGVEYLELLPTPQKVWEHP